MQTSHRLCHPERKNVFCALGVLNVTFPDKKLDGGSRTFLRNYNKIGLLNKFGAINEHVEITYLNDTEQMSFDEIADVIQIEVIHGV